MSTVAGSKEYGYSILHMRLLKTLEGELVDSLPPETFIDKIDIMHTLRNEPYKAEVHIIDVVGNAPKVLVYEKLGYRWKLVKMFQIDKFGYRVPQEIDI